MPTSFLHLDYELISQKYPQAVEKVKQWFLGRDEIKEGMKQLGVDINQDDVLNKFVASIINFDARRLYDVFDSMGIKVFIRDHPDYDNTFFYYNSSVKNSAAAESRIEAEEKAFTDVFELLEKAP